MTIFGGRSEDQGDEETLSEEHDAPYFVICFLENELKIKDSQGACRGGRIAATRRWRTAPVVNDSTGFRDSAGPTCVVAEGNTKRRRPRENQGKLCITTKS